MTMEKNKQFEDVSPIQNGDVPLSCQFSGGVHSHIESSRLNTADMLD